MIVTLQCNVVYIYIYLCFGNDIIIKVFRKLCKNLRQLVDKFGALHNHLANIEVIKNKLQKYKIKYSSHY